MDTQSLRPREIIMTMWGKTPEEIAALADKKRVEARQRERISLREYDVVQPLEAFVAATIERDRIAIENANAHRRRLLWGMVAIIVSGGVLLVVIALTAV